MIDFKNDPISQAIASLWQIDHTVFMNQDVIKFGLEISDPDYCKDETDAIAMADRDCNSIEEFIDNYDRLQDVVSTFQLCMMKQVNIYDVLHAKDYQEWLHMPAPLNIVDKKGIWHEDQVLTEDEFDQIRKYLTVYK